METLEGDPVHVIRCLWWATKMGSWLTMQPSTVNRMKLCAKEWRDALFLRCVLDPLDLPKFCDGRNSAFSICHDLYFKKGGLFTVRHNDLSDGVTDLAVKYFTSTHMRDDLLIFAGRVVNMKKEKTAGTTLLPTKQKSEDTGNTGELLISDL